MMRRAGVLLAVGALSGVLTELAIVHRPFHLLAVFAGVWVVGASWIGRRTDSPKAAAVHASAFLLGMVCAFYLTVLALESELRGTLWVFWLAIAVTGGPLLGLAGHLTRSATAWAGLAAAGLAGLLVAEAVRVWLGYSTPYRLGYALFNLAGAVLVLGRLRRGARGSAAAAFLPALAAGVIVFTAIPVLVYGGSHLPFQYR
ncbi:DUF6518 family protein [Actinomadura sp. NTSP31]|uniref:DUF6518 family protein n=1 Tax=Actinomadura sp. NTSP31 TaxID=1735447 RepID=UPI0035C113E3